MSIYSVNVGGTTHDIRVGSEIHNIHYGDDENFQQYCLYIGGSSCNFYFGDGMSESLLIIDNSTNVTWTTSGNMSFSVDRNLTLNGSTGCTLNSNNFIIIDSKYYTKISSTKYTNIGNSTIENDSNASGCVILGSENKFNAGTSAIGYVISGNYNTIEVTRNYRNGLLIAGNYCKVVSPTDSISGVTMYGYAGNIYSTGNNTRQVYIGCGYSSDYPKNALSIAKSSSAANNPTVYLNASANTSGAGLAEMYEWIDGNPESEDRFGRFVTTVGEKIRFATPEDSYVLGAVDPHPYLVGDCPTEEWHKRYLTDAFGIIIEDEVKNEETGEIELVARENPEWDPERAYVTRDHRAEFSPITSKGKVVLIDDGTCEVDGFATVGEGGIATKSDNNVSVRVLKRIDETHIRVYIDSAFLIKH